MAYLSLADWARRMGPDGNIDDIGELLDAPAAMAEPPSGTPPDLPPLETESLDYREYMRSSERRLLDWALARSGGSVTTAAKLLQLPRSTLRSKLEE